MVALAQAQSLPSEDDKAAFIRGMMDDPKRLDLQALREEFPEVFQAIETELRTNLERKLSSREALSVKEAYQRGLDQGSTAHRQWLASNIRYLTTTTDEAAVRYMMSRVDISMHLLETDARQCGIFVMTNNMRGFRRDDPELLRLMMVWSANTIRAIKAGIVTPNRDNVATAEDNEAIVESAVSLGLDEAELNNAFSGELGTAPPEDQCRADIVITAAIMNLKGAQRGRVARSMLTR